MSSQDNFSILSNTHNADNKVHKTSPHATSSSPNGVHGLNPRSCVTCRKRKVKCDKKPKCTNCIKANIDCVYPSPGRAPRKPRKPQDTELMDRLRKLEGVVQMLGTQVQEDDEKESSGEKENTAVAEEGVAEMTHEERISKAKKELFDLKKQKWEQDKDKKPPPQTGLEKRFGRLVVDEGRSRYINPSFWASLHDEVENIKEVLNDSDEEELDYPSPETTHSSNSHQGFLFSYSSQSVNMLELHPPPEHIPIYWRIFRENIDPLVKVIHAPTVEPTFLEAKDKLEKIHKGLECLMFTVYYAAVTSMWEEECRAFFGEEKSVLLSRYRFATEQALARADFLQTDEIIVLQAFVMFLVCLRRNDDARVIWTLTGLVVRMAQTLGLHRDGTHYGLRPFDIEMRRRLWWQICILDARASEDHGADPTIVEQLFDTNMPLNVNDVDLYPNMGALPEPKTGCTQMTFSLIRFEISNIMRRIQFVPPGPKRCNRFFSELSLDRKEKWVKELHERLENQYLKDTDMSVPLYWVIATTSRLIMSKMWLVIYHPFQRLDGGTSLPQDVRDKLFTTSLENVEYSLLLERDERTKRWGWLFRTYTQWHAVAFMLSELCTRTKGPEVERAWEAINFIVGRRWDEEHSDLQSNKMKGHLWRPLKKLMERAKKARDDTLRQEEEEKAKALTAQPPSVLDRSTSIMSLDFGVDRLFPPPGNDETVDVDGAPATTSASWTDPAILAPASDGYKASPASASSGHNILTPMDSTQGTTPAATNPFSLPVMSDAWLLNGDVTHIGESPGNFNETSNFFDTSTVNLASAPNQAILDSTSFDDTTYENGSPSNMNPLLPDGSVDWANFDSLVNQFGMDIDSTQVNQSQINPYGTTFGSLMQWY